ncbi:hypothetical protein PMI06_003092 [Burkholderia sp. BT03]|nr:hypothetical protein PMI06_003092 [Burkholderia sp. BT03]
MPLRSSSSASAATRDQTSGRRIASHVTSHACSNPQPRPLSQRPFVHGRSTNRFPPAQPQGHRRRLPPRRKSLRGQLRGRNPAANTLRAKGGVSGSPISVQLTTTEASMRRLQQPCQTCGGTFRNSSKSPHHQDLAPARPRERSPPRVSSTRPDQTFRSRYCRTG